MSSVAKFRDLLHGGKGTQSYEFSRMRAQFLLCHFNMIICVKFKLLSWEIQDCCYYKFRFFGSQNMIVK